MKIYESDWDTSTNDAEANAFKEIMANSIDQQDEPEVGIFWYDKNEDELFGVYSEPISSLKYSYSVLFGNHGIKTCKKLHYALWAKEYHRGKDKRFNGDYTKIPRGRIFYVEDIGFIVCVGKWIKQYKWVKDYILEEFNLPPDTTFKIDSHWDIGHGWSDKM